MTDKNLHVVDPLPNSAAATGSVDLTVEQAQPSDSYQLQSRQHPPSDLGVVAKSEAPLINPHAHEDLSGPETVPLCQSVEPSVSSLTVEISSSPYCELEVETTSHRIASPVGSSTFGFKAIPVASVSYYRIRQFRRHSHRIYTRKA